MVQDTQDGLAVDLEDVELDTASPDEGAGAEEDPVAVLRAELAATRAELSALSGLKALNPEQITRALGHIPALQRDFAEIRNRPVDPIATIDPRLSENEEVLSDLVDALLTSDFLDDSAKAALRQRRQRMEAGKTERDRVRLRRDLLEEVKGARETVQEEPTADAQAVLAVQAESSRLMGYAEAKNVDWSAIPPAELQFRPGETLEQSVARVRVVIDGLSGETADRVATRRRAAGAGAPASNGAGAFRTQRDVDTAHMEGRLTSAQVMQLRQNGRYAALPY